MWILALVIALAAGWLLARGLTGKFDGPEWLSVLIDISLGALFGPGLASIIYFFLVLAGAASSRGAVFAALAVLLLAATAVWFKRPSNGIHDLWKPRSWTWLLVLAAAVGLALFLADFASASSANPAGEWDAMSIWNLRAEFLAGGPATWHRAVSSELGGGLAGAAHPGYPLFLSSFIAMQWIVGSNMPDTIVPIVTSLVFPLAVFLLLGASLASKRTLALGALGWLILLCSEVFVSQAASQYSDLLQGLSFLAALVLLDRAESQEGLPRILFAAGLALGLAAWVKNEGLPFAIAGLAVAAWRHRSRALWTALGAIPGFLALAVLKLFVAQGHEAVFPSSLGEIVSKLATPGRWWQALLGFGKAIVDAGSPWTHPVILAALLFFVLKLLPKADRQNRWLLWIPVAATAAAEYGLYLVTTADLDWHIATSVSRLLAQLWPPLIWLVLSALHPPEFYCAKPEPPLEPVAVRSVPRKKR
jgi:hypothetical protein